MTPSISDYLHGLRRLWWVPILALLVGTGISVTVVNGALPSVTTTSNVLFTFRVAETGQDSAGSARGAEAEVAEVRLSGYIQLVLTSQPIHAILAERGILTTPTTTSATTGQAVDASAQVLIAPTVSGIVEIRLYNEGLSQADATELTKAIADEVARSIIATDSLQASPSLRPDPVVTDPASVAEPPSIMKLALPVLLMIIAGLAAVYVIVWAQGRIWTSSDIEERLGARTLGDSAGLPADGVTIALALTKDRNASTRALLVPVGSVSAGDAQATGELIANAWIGLNRPVTLTTASEAVRQPSSTLAKSRGEDPGDPEHLEVVVAANGLDVEALHAAVSADVVGLIVSYGGSRYRELTQAGRALDKVTDASIAVVGISKKSSMPAS